MSWQVIDSTGRSTALPTREAALRVAEALAQTGQAVEVVDSEGNRTTISALLPRGAPPSTYAALAVIEGQEGAWPRLAVCTGVRAIAIAPGLWIAGLRGMQLALASLLGSSSISIALLLLYMARRQSSGVRDGAPALDPAGH